MKQRTFIRFELGFDGEHQSIGFLQGIEDIRLPIKTEITLIEPFEDMPSPVLFGSCEFWFTEEGLAHFADALTNISKVIKDYGWCLMYTKKEADPKSAMYLDDWQAAWKIKKNRQKYHFTQFESFPI